VELVFSVGHRSGSWYEDPAVCLGGCNGSCGGCPLGHKLALELVNLSCKVGGDGGGFFSGGDGSGFLFDLVGSGCGLFDSVGSGGGLFGSGVVGSGSGFFGSGVGSGGG
jgi:hypothetical protein